MQFDECTPYPADKITAERSLDLSLDLGQSSQKILLLKKKVIYLE